MSNNAPVTPPQNPQAATPAAPQPAAPKMSLKQKLVKLGNTPVPLPPIPGLARLNALAGAGGYGVPQEYLGQRSFVATIAFAAMLHIGVFYVWAMIPRTEVLNIPVRALSIKLSDGEPMTAEEIAAAQPDASNSNALENALSDAVEDPMQQQARSAASAIERALNNGGTGDAVSKAMEKALANPESELSVADPSQRSGPKQFVRNTNVQAKGSPRGNSTGKDAELMKRYEQLISLWIEKFKQYPMDARSQGLQGETVVRIRIDRKGNIRYYLLERSTGHPVLDRAAIDMVRRANPVPSVPNDYPKGDLIEFLIPVNFQLQ